MLTRFVRTQLIIFTIASVVGVLVMVFNYLQAPTLLGVGRITVKLELPASGGLYKFSNVTYRGVQLGKVTSVDLTRDGAVATLSLDTSPKVPRNLRADVRSVSAVGEQYVDLRPLTDDGPYLEEGSVIPASAASIPQEVGPVLDQVSKLVQSLPKEQLSNLLDETYKGFNGAGYDFGSLLDSTSTLTADLGGVADQTRSVIDDSGTLLDANAQTVNSIREWAAGLAGVTSQLETNDPQVRTILQTGPGSLNEATTLLDQVKPTLPVLLANLTTLTEITMTYDKSIEQLLVVLPPYVASTQSYGTVANQPMGQPIGEFAITVGDPPPCTVGFLPPSSWRNPADTTVIDTPDGIYCKLPQDSPINVRGARNYPCMRYPGKRAPTVELCNDPQGFQPLGQRQHVAGPHVIDPNLVAQGVPPDDRYNFNQNIYGPVEGTPLPPGAVPAGTPPAGAPGFTPDLPPGTPGSATVPPPSVPAAPGPVYPPPPPPGGPLPAAPPAPLQPLPSPAVGPPAEAPVPAAAAGAPADGAGSYAATGPSVAVTHYNPRTGEYQAPDGQLYSNPDLVSPRATTWQEMLPR